AAAAGRLKPPQRPLFVFRSYAGPEFGNNISSFNEVFDHRQFLSDLFRADPKTKPIKKSRCSRLENNGLMI
ncbi:MAG: hypothetical protein ACYSOH_01775, partial [Planctomycetota bacterium]